MSRLADLSDEYLASRRGAGYAVNTVKNDRQTMNKLIAALGNIDVARIDSHHMDLFFARHSHLQPSSLNQLQDQLAAFFAWCRQRRYLKPDADPLAGRRRRKVPKRERNRIHLSKFPALLDAAGAYHPRDRAGVALGLFLMLRQSEIASLRVRDVDLAAGSLAVTIHKTGDHDLMPISAELDTELRRWLTAYAELCGTLEPDWYLIPSKTRVPDARNADGTFTRRAFEKLRPTRKTTRLEDIAKRALEGAGEPLRDADGRSLGEGFHTLRRSAARAVYDELRDAGYDGAMARAQTFLHHSSVTMTERYLGITLDRDRRDEETRGQPLLPSLTGVLSEDGDSGDAGVRLVRGA